MYNHTKKKLFILFAYPINDKSKVINFAVQIIIFILKYFFLFPDLPN